MPKPIAIFKYFGAKNSQVRYRLFSKPSYKTIVEPFAGSGAYAVYHSCWAEEIILNELDPAIHEIHKLIFERTDEFASYEIPQTESKHDAITDEGYKNWVSSYFNFSGTGIGRSSYPSVNTICYQKYFCKPEDRFITFRSGKKNTRDRIGCEWLGFRKENIVEMVRVIKLHCKKITLLNQDGAELIKNNKNKLWSWFIDPPYMGINGESYNIENKINYNELATSIMALQGHSITTEQDNADWLPFLDVREVVSAAVIGDKHKKHNLVVFEQGNLLI